MFSKALDLNLLKLCNLWTVENNETDRENSLNIILNIYITLSQSSHGFYCLPYKSFENTVGKGEITRNE